MSLASLNTEPGDFLYRPLFRSGATWKLIYRNKKVELYKGWEVSFGKKMKLVALDLNLGLHSLRASDCTKAALENINDRCLKRHGRC